MTRLETRSANAALFTENKFENNLISPTNSINETAKAIFAILHKTLFSVNVWKPLLCATVVVSCFAVSEAASVCEPNELKKYLKIFLDCHSNCFDSGMTYDKKLCMPKCLSQLAKRVN
jgi:hypothetical protein